MGHSRAEKAENRERILKEAALQAREGGLASLNIVKLMKSASLTHGGFYGHFASRAELEVEALKRALVEGERRYRASGKSEGITDMKTLAKRYLSRTHRDNPAEGCAIAALGAEVGHSEMLLRNAMEPHIEHFIANVRNAAPDEESAITAVCAMVGGLMLARVVTDPDRSDAILRAVVRNLSEINSDREY